MQKLNNTENMGIQQYSQDIKYIIQFTITLNRITEYQHDQLSRVYTNLHTHDTHIRSRLFPKYITAEYNQRITQLAQNTNSTEYDQRRIQIAQNTTSAAHSQCSTQLAQHTTSTVHVVYKSTVPAVAADTGCSQYGVVRLVF